MANRSYIYSLNNRPTSFTDRPETICGLSEWPWGVPFSYRVLMSCDPQICSSLLSDGFAGESPKEKTRIYAISEDFDKGLERLKKFMVMIRSLADGHSAALKTYSDQTIAFLEEHRDRYLLLETVELDSIWERDETMLRACVKREITTCRNVGAALEALPEDPCEAAEMLKHAAETKCESPLDVFHGLRLDGDCDNIRDDKTEYPLGISFWSDVLYFSPQNRAEFDTSP